MGKEKLPLGCCKDLSCLEMLELLRSGLKHEQMQLEIQKQLEVWEN